MPKITQMCIGVPIMFVYRRLARGKSLTAVLPREKRNVKSRLLGSYFSKGVSGRSIGWTSLVQSMPLSGRKFPEFLRFY